MNLNLNPHAKRNKEMSHYYTHTPDDTIVNRFNVPDLLKKMINDVQPPPPPPPHSHATIPSSDISVTSKIPLEPIILGIIKSGYAPFIIGSIALRSYYLLNNIELPCAKEWFGPDTDLDIYIETGGSTLSDTQIGNIVSTINGLYYSINKNICITRTNNTVFTKYPTYINVIKLFIINIENNTIIQKIDIIHSKLTIANVISTFDLSVCQISMKVNFCVATKNEIIDSYIAYIDHFLKLYTYALVPTPVLQLIQQYSMSEPKKCIFYRSSVEFSFGSSFDPLAILRKLPLHFIDNKPSAPDPDASERKAKRYKKYTRRGFSINTN